MPENDQYILQSVDNALAIIDLLGRREELGVAEISREMGLGKSTVFRLLTTLERRRFVSKTEASKYRLGIKLSALGAAVLGRMEIIRYAHPHLVALTGKTGETSHLVIWDSETQVRFIDKVISNSTIRMDSTVGLRRRAHMTATGKVLLAAQPEEFVRNYLQKADFTPKTEYSITTAAQLQENLAEIRARGYGCDLDESEVGLTCFAAPVTDMNGAVTAAISISGPSQRMNSRRDELIGYLCAAAAAISGDIG